MINTTIENERVFKENGLTFTEVICQEYGGNNCVISAGFVKGKINQKKTLVISDLKKTT